MNFEELMIFYANSIHSLLPPELAIDLYEQLFQGVPTLGEMIDGLSLHSTVRGRLLLYLAPRSVSVPAHQPVDRHPHS